MRDGLHKIFFTESDDANNHHANENYGTAKRFLLTPGAGQVFYLKQLTWVIGDNDSDYNLYGNMASLTTGIRLVLEDTDGNELQDLLAGVPIKKTEDFTETGFTLQPLNSVAGDIRITQAIQLFELNEITIRYKERLAWIIPAIDFTGLEKHSLLAHVVKKGLY